MTELPGFLLAPALALAERGAVPESAIRWGIRRLCGGMLPERGAGGSAESAARLRSFADSLRESEIALSPERANEQHYEVPAEFFERVLGPRLKYSSCHWSGSRQTLADAEEEALAITSENAGLEDGQRVLELGCGWGSWTLWMAERFPSSEITAVTNSRIQERVVVERARARSLDNVRVVKCDVNRFETSERFERVVSVEMFEHLRNYEAILARVAGWLERDGELFVHVFCHRTTPHLYETQGAANWMGRWFFTGGVMPSRDLFSCFDRDLEVVRRWDWSGTHYARTSEAWLERLGSGREDIRRILSRAYGEKGANVWYHRWRIFFLACAELFAYRGGSEWGVSHYRFARAGTPARAPARVESP